MNRKLLISFIIFILQSLACGSSSQFQATTRLPDVTSEATPVVSTQNSDIDPDKTLLPSTEDIRENQKILQLWPSEVLSDIEFADTEFFTGGLSEITCDNEPYPWFFPIENTKETYTLDFLYPYSLIPLEIKIYLSHPTDDTFTISVGNGSNPSFSQVYAGKIPFNNTCPSVFTIPINIPETVDHISLEFSDIDNPVQINSIELVGILPHFVDMTPEWRVSIPADDLADADSQFPGGMAFDKENIIYIANGQNGLIKIDQDGRIVDKFFDHENTNFTDVYIDKSNNMVVADMISKEFSVVSGNGTRNVSGGMDFSVYSPRSVAVSPINGNVYLLDVGDVVNRVQVYKSDTGEYLHEIALEKAEYPSYKGLAFDTNGYLYTLDIRRGSIIKMDVDSQKIVAELADIYLHNVGTADIAIDNYGNFYILIHSSPENVAIYVLDPNGEMIKRFGNLTYDGSEHEPGTFMFPVSLAVSDDRKMLAVCESGFISAYRLE